MAQTKNNERKNTCCHKLNVYNQVAKNRMNLEHHPLYHPSNLISSRAILNNPDAIKLLPENTQKKHAIKAAFHTAKCLNKYDTHLKILSVGGLIFSLLVALSVMGDSAKAIGARSFTEFFTFANDPVIAFGVGLATTVAFQSSSTVTSLTTVLVGAGVLPKNIAFYTVSGANLGTTSTNGLVSLAWLCSMSKKEFANRFAKTTIHDIFNIWSLTFAIILQATFVFFNLATNAMTVDLTNDDNANQQKKVSFLKTFTGPVSKFFLSVDKNAMKNIAKNPDAKLCYDSIIKKGLFSSIDATDETKGLMTLAASILIFSYSLYKITRITSKLITMQHNAHRANPNDSCITKTNHIYNRLTQPCSKIPPAISQYLKGYATIFFSIALTILAQSSSVTTSLFTIALFDESINENIFMELVIGANIGTVFSSIMAALSAKSHTKDAFQVAYAHLLFNSIGLLSLYPVPKIRNLALIQPAKHIEKLLKKSKGFAVAYLTSLYIALPTLVCHYLTSAHLSN